MPPQESSKELRQVARFGRSEQGWRVPPQESSEPDGFFDPGGPTVLLVP